MIRLVIEVDDHPTWAEYTKEAVAERLAELGSVRVVEVTVDKPQQTSLFRPPAPKNTCPRCGSTRVTQVRGPDGETVLREVIPRPFWPDAAGPVWAMGMDDSWQRGHLEGDKDAPHTIGWPIHQCNLPS